MNHSPHPQAAAARLQREMSVRMGVSFAVGLCFWAAVEFLRWAYFSQSLRAWSLRGWAMPVISLMVIGALVSATALRAATGKSGPIPRKIQPEDLIRFYESADEEALRVVRGLATCTYIVAFVYGVLVSFVVAFNVVP